MEEKKKKEGRPPMLPSLKRAEAIRFFRKRLEGKNNVEVAEEAGVSHDTVRRYLTWGEKAGIFAHIEDQLFGTLLPLAEQTLIEAMQDGDAQVALEIYKGTQVLRDAKTVAAMAQTKMGDVDPLAAYVNKIRLEEADERGTIEGRISGEQKLLPTHGDGGGNSDAPDGQREISEVSGNSTEIATWERLATMGTEGDGKDSGQGVVAGTEPVKPATERADQVEVESGISKDADEGAEGMVNS